MKLIYIEWLDACSANHWHTHEEVIKWAKDKNDPYIKQVGWVLYEDDKLLVLASRRGANIYNGADPDEQNYGLLQKIPKTWIRKRKIIKI